MSDEQNLVGLLSMHMGHNGSLVKVIEKRGDLYVVSTVPIPKRTLTYNMPSFGATQLEEDCVILFDRHFDEEAILKERLVQAGPLSLMKTYLELNPLSDLSKFFKSYQKLFGEEFGRSVRR